MTPEPGVAPAIETKRVRTRGTVVIDIEACKGCDLCIDACPPGVLSMTVQARNERGYRYPELHQGCTACQACSQVCPDFVFQVWKFETPVDEPLAGGGATPVGDGAGD
jgi:2-oxoglutarate ferredoxin oxidoreductase subunit delta